MLEKTQGQGIIKNAQSKDTGNIGQTRHRKKTNKTQEEDKQDTGRRQTRHKKKTNKTQEEDKQANNKNKAKTQNKQLNI